MYIMEIFRGYMYAKFSIMFWGILDMPDNPFCLGGWGGGVGLESVTADTGTEPM